MGGGGDTECGGGAGVLGADPAEGEVLGGVEYPSGAVLTGGEEVMGEGGGRGGCGVVGRSMILLWGLKGKGCGMKEAASRRGGEDFF